MTLALPPLVRWSPNPLRYLLYWIPFIVTYQLVNRWPLVPPRELPLTALDRLVPFVPELLPLYVAYLPFYWWTVARARTDREVNELFYATHALLLLSLPWFVFCPVRMPLEQFYAPTPHNWADALWRWFDAPQNCFPSLHVSSCLLFLEVNWRRPGRVPASLVALAIAASTVLVKQHYVLDVLGGMVAYGLVRAARGYVTIGGVDAAGWRPGRVPPRHALLGLRPARPPQEVS